MSDKWPEVITLLNDIKNGATYRIFNGESGICDELLTPTSPNRRYYHSWLMDAQVGGWSIEKVTTPTKDKGQTNE